jgi:hypothetical protein
MFVLSLNLVNVFNLLALGGMIYCFYNVSVVSRDQYDNLTYLKPRYHFLPVNVDKYREDRLEFIQSLIKEYNELYDTSLLLVEEDSDDSDDSDDSEDDSLKEENGSTVVEGGDEKVETVVVKDDSVVEGGDEKVETVVVKDEVDNIESAN